MPAHAEGFGQRMAQVNRRTDRGIRPASEEKRVCSGMPPVLGAKARAVSQLSRAISARLCVFRLHREHMLERSDCSA
jgi:hypothetical protein